MAEGFATLRLVIHVGLFLVAAGVVGGFVYWLRVRARAAALPRWEPVPDGEMSAMDLSAPDLSSPFLPALEERPVEVPPPPVGPHMGVAIGLVGTDGTFAPLIPKGRGLPAKAATTLTTDRAGQQRIEVPVMTSAGTGRRAGRFCGLTVRGLAPGRPGRPVRLLVAVDRSGRFAARAKVPDGGPGLLVELDAESPTLPVARTP